jgi:hypothetical protein
MNDLDALLSQPLPSMPDNGFSARVMVEMQLRQLRRERLRNEILTGLVVLGVMILPFTGLGRMAGPAFSQFGMALSSLALGAVLVASARNSARR